MSDRRSEIVKVPDAPWAGRDNGKTFQITEWGARRAETWAWGMVFALKGSSGEIPLDVARLGMVGVGVRLINTILKADVDFAAVKPFYDELIDECVKIVRDPSNIDRASGGVVATKLLIDDVSEMPTLQWLRSEVIRVHTNFSMFDALSGLLDQIRSWQPSPAPSTMSTSLQSSEPPSADAPS